MADIIEEDEGVPEESQNTLEQINAVETLPNAPWKVPGEDKFIFQNSDDLIELGDDVYRASNSRYVVVIVLDNNNPPYTAYYPEHKQFFIGETLPAGTIFWQPYTEFFIKALDEEIRITEQTYEQFKINSIQVGTFRGIRIYVPDPNFNHNRPESQTEATTSSTTGNTVVTTTSLNPAAAGVVTTSNVIPAEVSGTQVYDDAILRQARNILPANLPSLNPCLPGGAPVNQAGGSGSTPPARPSYDDAILRQARARGAAPASTAPAAGAAPATSTTAPTTVTTQQQGSSTAPSSTPPTPSNVYIYEPLSPGFDRYDFNSGKKVFTPDTGPSRNSSNVSVTPTATPRVLSRSDPNFVGPQ